MAQDINIVLEKFQIFNLEQDVVSCAQAALSKGIPIENELKSLILQTSTGLCVLHISGNKNASLRSIKRTLKVNEAFLANTKQLHELNVIPGTVCPFLPQLWQLRQLISSSVLDLPFVSTNNGTRNQYILFHPECLLRSPQHIIGCFECKC